MQTEGSISTLSIPTPESPISIMRSPMYLNAPRGCNDRWGREQARQEKVGSELCRIGEDNSYGR